MTIESIDAIDEEIARGQSLLTDDTAADAITFFAEVCSRYSNDARVWFAYAGAFDFAGQEAEALAPYQKAAELGLPEHLWPRWYVQYGSTLRNVERHGEAVRVLEEGHARHPDHLAIAAFLALARFSAGQGPAALQGLLQTLIRMDAASEVDLSGYQRALTYYADALLKETADEISDHARYSR